VRDDAGALGLLLLVLLLLLWLLLLLFLLLAGGVLLSVCSLLPAAACWLASRGAWKRKLRARRPPVGARENESSEPTARPVKLVKGHNKLALAVLVHTDVGHRVGYLERTNWDLPPPTCDAVKTRVARGEMTKKKKEKEGQGENEPQRWVCDK
jgi:hypothetical protein